MGPPVSLMRFGRLFIPLASAAGLAAALYSPISCGPLQPELGADNSGQGDDNSGDGGVVTTEPDTVLEGGLPDQPVKKACMDSMERLPHTPGTGLDVSAARGYRSDPTIPMQAAMLLPPNNVPVRANQMRGTPPTSGGLPSFNDIYRTLDDTTAQIKGVLFRDGPRGVNLLSPVYTGPFGSNPLDLGPGYATVFPVSAAHGATWDLDLEQQIGEDLADEVLASGNTLSISPCVNILRHPAWGRSQETYGEDTFLLGRMGSAYVQGVQQYIPACVKHFAGYNIEDGRFNQNAIMDDQTLHEIYGRHFEMIVQEGGVACVMASYNSINGVKSTANHLLLTDILRNTFGFKGFVMSDFWAMPGAQQVNLMPAQYGANAQGGVSAGLDMEMPWSLNYAYLESLQGVMPQLTQSATNIIEQKLRFNVLQTGIATQQLGLRAPKSTLGPQGVTNNDAHIADAEKQAEEAMVLLKNDNKTLPINRGSVRTVAVIGASVDWKLPYTGQTGTQNFATDPRIGDLGSSRVAWDPAKSVGPAAGIAAAAGTGINVVSGTDPSIANNADFVVVVAGLTPFDEGEEYTGAGDRTDIMTFSPHLGLDPKSSSNVQDNLITTVAAMGKPMAVVLEAGSAVNMPWLSMVPAVVMAWYPGQAGGTALGKLLFGDVNFGGKLPITWPKSEADEPPFNQGGNGGSTTMDYYLGYRYFDKNGIKPLFPFGWGMSYTQFQYAFLGVPCSSVTKNGVVDVQVAVTNTGTVAGNEVAFLFVSYPDTKARRSVKELKGFHRTQLILPGQTHLFTIPLRIQDLKYWNSNASPPAWTVESGRVEIMVGGSSDNLPLTDMLTVE
jgi:beta-glucosidase